MNSPRNVELSPYPVKMVLSIISLLWITHLVQDIDEPIFHQEHGLSREDI